MFVTDLVALEFCVFLAYLVRLALDPIWPIGLTPDQYQQIAIGVLALPVAFQVMGFYPGYGVCPVMRLRRRVLSTLVLFGILIAWAYLQQYQELSRGILLFSMAFALVIPWVMEAFVRDLLKRRGLWGQPTVIIGAGEAGRAAAKALKARSDMGYVPVALFDEDASEWGRVYDGLPVDGGLARANEFAASGVKTAVLAMSDLDGVKAARMVERLNFENVIVIPNLFGMPSVWVTPIDFQEGIGLQVKNNLQVGRNYMIKRALDYMVALPATLAALPFIALAALAVKLVDGGPVFFVHRRRGQNGRPIDVYKIRTMYKDADHRLQVHLANNPDAKAEWDRYMKLRNDPRVLPGVGHILRKFSLDELPQLFNVLRGDMSLVGPRPFPDYHLDQFDEKFRELRLSVPPGITGFWQVSSRSDGDLEVQERLDTYYIRNWSLWLDFYILLRTALIVVKGSGAR